MMEDHEKEMLMETIVGQRSNGLGIVFYFFLICLGSIGVVYGMAALVTAPVHAQAFDFSISMVAGGAILIGLFMMMSGSIVLSDVLRTEEDTWKIPERIILVPPGEWGDRSEEW